MRSGLFNSWVEGCGNIPSQIIWILEAYGWGWSWLDSPKIDQVLVKFWRYNHSNESCLEICSRALFQDREFHGQIWICLHLKWNWNSQYSPIYRKDFYVTLKIQYFSLTGNDSRVDIFLHLLRRFSSFPLL